MPGPVSVTERQKKGGGGHGRAEPHGGDPEADAVRLYGLRRRDWLDLSTGINRRPYPLPVLPAHCWRDLPRTQELAALTAAAARYYGLKVARFCLAVPGSQSAISLLPQALRRLLPAERGRCAVVSPTYGEHAPAWRAGGWRVVLPPDLAAARASGAEVVVVVNPNNPDGRLWTPGELRRLAEHQARRGGFLLVDEAFCDLVPAASLAPVVGELPGLIVLRSVGKFFGLAGLRLGFVLADERVLDSLRGVLGPWPVGGPALLVGQQALADVSWITRTRRQLVADAARLDRLLTAFGLQVVGGTALFRLCAWDEAGALHAALAHEGIWIRRFVAHPHWLRFGIPGNAAEFARLEAALAAVMRSGGEEGA